MNKNTNLVNGNIKTAKKRITRKDIYFGYGIDYKDGKIFAPVFGWIPELLINGNEKIGDGVWHYSTLPTTNDYTAIVNGVEYTEKGTCPCTCGEYKKDKNGDYVLDKNGEKIFVTTCYGTKGNYVKNAKTIIPGLLVKSHLTRHYPDFVERAISAQIIADKIAVLRVHATGDFVEPEIDIFRNIAKAFPYVTFWTYTKVEKAESAFDDIYNFNVVKSFIPGKGFNYGTCSYIISLYEYLKQMDIPVFICRCGVDKNQHCNECSKCSENKYVLFLEHSTSYKPEKDPLYPVFCELVNSQDFTPVDIVARAESAKAQAEIMRQAAN